MARSLAHGCPQRLPQGPSGPPPAALGGYLARLAPSELMQRHEAQLPTSMRGADFLAAYTTHYDTITSIDPDKE